MSFSIITVADVESSQRVQNFGRLLTFSNRWPPGGEVGQLMDINQDIGYSPVAPQIGTHIA